MTLHITGEEFEALVLAIFEMPFDELSKAVNSDELWISVRKVDCKVYQTEITNQIAKFQE